MSTAQRGAADRDTADHQPLDDSKQETQRRFQPEPHRCKPELMDVVDTLFEAPGQIGSAFRKFVRCVRTDPAKPPPGSEQL